MKTKTFMTVLLMAIILASCAPAATSVSSTITSASAATTTPPTGRPHILLQQDTILYSGPGNTNFDPIKTLKNGDAIYALGVYVDFVQVMASIDGNDVTGFVYKNALGSLPENIPELTADSVPWKPLFLPECSPGIYNFETKVLAFENTGDDSSDIESTSITLETPLHLRVDGIQVKGNSHGSIKILGRPLTTSSWWKDVTRMDIGYNEGSYVIYVRDGTDENIHFWLGDLGLSASETIQIVFEQVEGKSFVVLDGNNRQIRHIDLTQQSGLKLPNGLFPEGKVHIGTSTAPYSSLNISNLQIGTLATGRWLEDTNLYPGLAELASKHNLTIGTEFSISQSMNIQHCRTMKHNFNVAAIGLFSWKGIWLGPGQYDFSSLDREVDYAVSQGWRPRASHLVWGAAGTIPDWLLTSKYTRDEYIRILEQHIKTLVGRYKGRVQEWSIANEAPGRSFAHGDDFWNDKIGPDYIGMAFRWAREADPDGILIFNEVNNENPRDSFSQQIITKMYSMVKELKDNDVPIDAVGMQMHLLLGRPTVPEKADVIATMHEFSDLGVKIYITEFDVDLHNQTGSPEELLQFQANVYRDMLEACLESNVCESFTTWGISDSTSWLTSMCPEDYCIKHPDADPLMFDRDYNPKPAYFAVRDVLLNFSMPSTP
jgi:endo-1,4-beta-xylanase